MKLIEVLGTRLEVHQIEAPTGLRPRAPIVFLHEGLGSVSMWRDRQGFWPAQVCAATGRGGVVYSRRGYGRSEPIPNVRGEPDERAGVRSGRLLPDYMQHEAWHTLPALLAQLHIDKPVLLGHSDGATIALLHASRHPVAGCIVLAPHVMVEDVTLQAIAQARKAYETGTLRERLARHHLDVDNAFWQWNDVWLSEGFRSFDIRPDLARIGAPVLAIQGQDDPYGSMAQVDEIAAALPGRVVLHKLPGCGHAPQREQMVPTTRLVRDFLDTVP